MKRIAVIVVLAAFAAAAAGCGELDHTGWGKQMKARSDSQNENRRIGH